MAAGPIYRFAGFSLDTDAGLLRNGSAEIALRPKSFDLLSCLIRNAGRVVPKAELMDAVWPDVTVTEDSLTQTISDIRRALGDEAQILVHTIPRRGYRFVIERLEVASDASSGAVHRENQTDDEAKPSIAVLPFSNLSGDPEQEYFADGISEDIITELSRVKWFFVIARNSSFTYKGKAVDAKQVGRELGVRYLLEGSVRKAGDRVRITGQLVDAETGRHVWADKFDGRLEDIFELQDRITEAIVGAVEPTLKLAELQRMRGRATDSLAAYDLCLRALPNINSVITTRKFNDDALGLLYRAVALDPGYSLAKALAAYAYVLRKSQHWSTVVEDAEGVRLATEALEAHADHPTTLACAGHALAYLGKRYDAAVRALDRASSLGGSSWRVLTSSGWVSNYICDAKSALQSFERAMRLNPIDPEIGFSLSGIATAHMIAGRYGDALSVGSEAIDAAPTWATCYRIVVFALVELGHIDGAREIAQKLLRVSPGFSVSLYRSTGTFRKVEFFERYLTALLRAGIPD
ncbi:winged helix-turn-helix domain-containing tetratricopeptide repeat protein [Mesorhizobium sp. B2-7-2]|uniref:winged helix-turn-helix domain-containing tetratricopeptide repeat protein n=1 Tax=Mesorhizobium sp. B2-7-2 TaxID=2589908 RepID=UPI00112E0DB0|nr:winged helix-turn-helix domain-containing tetratricopeptide repeat protein [Mesorhizobium sp. B2-7-2]TPJ31558.1 CadC-family transcriptional regulator [Mesorhizobium sp. B2-7-2]